MPPCALRRSITPLRHKVGVADGVVVGVDEVGTVLPLGLAMRIGLGIAPSVGDSGPCS